MAFMVAMFWGVEQLSHIISKLKNSSGKVLVPGFYEKVRKISQQEKQEIADFPLTSEQIIVVTGAGVVVGETNKSIPERKKPSEFSKPSDNQL